ncbi:MAG: GGDEF domain-containing protein, partial [Solirubrobacteraceae bacterium]
AGILDRAPWPPAGSAEPLHAGRAKGEGRNGVPFVVDVSFTARMPSGHRVALLRKLDATQLIAESQRLLDVAFASAPIGVALFNPDGQYLRVNPALCRLLDRSEEQLLGRRDQEFTHPDDRAEDVEVAWRVLRGELDTWQTEKRFVRPDGSVVWAIANLTFLRDDEGRPLAWLGQFQDITQRKSLEQRMRRLAEEDPLTGLPNRRSFEGALQLALDLNDRHGHVGTLLMIDLDGFKEINDTHGHAVGDATLVAVARALRSRLRRTDLLARYGGDEFAVLLRLTRSDRAQHVVGALERVVRDTTLGAAGPAISLTVSIGLAEFGPDSAQTRDALFAAADAAMYEAKRRSRPALD